MNINIIFQFVLLFIGKKSHILDTVRKTRARVKVRFCVKREKEQSGCVKSDLAHLTEIADDIVLC